MLLIARHPFLFFFMKAEILNLIPPRVPLFALSDTSTVRKRDFCELQSVDCNLWHLCDARGVTMGY